MSRKLSLMRGVIDAILLVLLLAVSVWCFAINSWARSQYVAADNSWIDTSSKGVARMGVFLVLVPALSWLFIRAFSDATWLRIAAASIPFLCAAGSEIEVAVDDTRAHAYFRDAEAAGRVGQPLYWSRQLLLGEALVTKFPDGSFATSD